MIKAFTHTYRYLDDIIVINHGLEFDKYKDSVYPTSLILNKTNVDSLSAEVLDLDVSIHSNKFTYKVFDKTANFGFQVLKLPQYDSLMPLSIIVNSATNELIRHINNSYSLEQAIASCGVLLKTLHVRNGIPILPIMKKFASLSNERLKKFYLHNISSRKRFISHVTQFT